MTGNDPFPLVRLSGFFLDWNANVTYISTLLTTQKVSTFWFAILACRGISVTYILACPWMRGNTVYTQCVPLITFCVSGQIHKEVIKGTHCVLLIMFSVAVSCLNYFVKMYLNILYQALKFSNLYYYFTKIHNHSSKIFCSLS